MIDNALPVVHLDEHLVAVSQPAGLLVHRSPIDAHETRFALQILRRQLGRRVHAVHRLDKATSGLLLFAFSPEATAACAASFEAGAVDKRYLAIVRGWTAEEGVVDHALHREDDPPEAEPQPARTRFRRLATVELPFRVDRYPHSRYSLVELQPMTGRRHQLRRHMAHLSHPVIGDTTHGQGRHNRLFRAEFDCQRLLLASVQLSLPHPVTGEPLVITAPLEGVFAALVERFGWTGAVPPKWRDPASLTSGSPSPTR